MCSTCGCEGDGATIEHHHGHQHHHHEHTHSHSTAPEAERVRRVAVEQDLLARNNAQAAVNRQLFTQAGVLALNWSLAPARAKPHCWSKRLSGWLVNYRWR
jgi:hydrogenase nickel incorporation protein HypB